MDTNGFVLTVKTNGFVNDLQNLKNVSDYSSLNKNHELISNKNKESFGQL